jgi:hypothetical protein
MPKKLLGKLLKEEKKHLIDLQTALNSLRAKIIKIKKDVDKVKKVC